MTSGPVPVPAGSASADSVPSDPAELREVTTAVLREVLGVPEVLPDDDFFALGGNSLLAVRVAGRLSRVVQRRVPVTAVLDHPSARALADTLSPAPGARIPDTEGDRAAPAVAPHGPAVGTDVRNPLTAAQRRVWLLHAVDPERIDHLVTSSFRITGAFDPAVARTAWTSVVRRHEALRTRFEEDDGETVQIVDPEPLTDFRYLDLTALDEAVAARVVSEQVRLQRGTPLDLVTGPPARVLLLRTAPDTYRLEVVVHHIVCDGWSVAVLFDDFLDAYRATVRGEPEAPPPAHRFSDHVRWEREVESRRWPGMTERVARRFEGRTDHLPLPVDPRDVDEHEDGDDVELPVPPEVSAALAGIGKVTGYTRLTPALAALGILLHRISGTDDVLIAVPVSGRVRPEDEATVGLFVNTALARVRLAGARDVPKLLARVHEEVQEVLDCQTFPFDHLVSRLAPHREAGRMPLVRVSLAVQDFAEPAAPPPGLGFGWEWSDPPERQSKLDLAFSLWGGGAGAAERSLTITYRPSLFRRSTVEAWGEQYLVALGRVCDAARRAETCD
ncbi:condensation domain-containing protein [Streptomyces roseolilacinus]|uniref:condensation domain-containing protein n=1 Tax=Streptomyces roseolilacinus TaxID=66904 RepID=UPI003824311D